MDGLCTACGAEQPVTEGLEYTLNEEGTAYTVTGIDTVNLWEGTVNWWDGIDIVIAATYEGKPVTSIDYMAFSDCRGLTSVTIPASVTSIGNYAFSNCDALKNVTIGSGTTSIGIGAFSRCTSLESITLPFVGATKDGTENTHFGYIFGAQSYDYNQNCVPQSLKTVIIIGGTSIGDYAFYGCSDLMSIAILDDVTSIGKGAFRNCYGLKSVTISSSVDSIGEGAFSKCTSLTSIIIPDSVENIDERAFYGCTKLTSVKLGNGVTSIGSSVFSCCTSLERIIVGSDNEKYHSSGNCLIETASKILISGCKNSVIPTNGSVTSISDYAFYGCSGLESITIPSCIIYVGYYAFYDCSALVSITFADTDTWYRRHDYLGGIEGIQINVADKILNVRYFTDIYAQCYWYKK